MSARGRERRRPGAGRRERGAGGTALRWGVRLLVVALVFWAGVALGRAVEETPRPGGTQTVVRTLEPVTVAPPPETVTVTVPAP